MIKNEKYTALYFIVCIAVLVVFLESTVYSANYSLNVGVLKKAVQVYPYENGYSEKTSFKVNVSKDFYSDQVVTQLSIPLKVERFRLDFTGGNKAVLDTEVVWIERSFLFRELKFYDLSQSILTLNSIMIEDGDEYLTLRFNAKQDPYLDLSFPLEGHYKSEIKLNPLSFLTLFVLALLILSLLHFQRLRRKWPATLAALMLTGFFVVVFSFFEIKFMTNDDVAMLLTANGFVNNFEPSQHLVFISVWIGFLLKNLYVYESNLQWYSLFLILIHGGSIFTILYALLTSANKQWQLQWVMILVLVFFEARFLTSLTFTTTAFIAIISAVVALTEISSRKVLDKNLLFLACFCFVIGAMLRHSAFIGILSLALPFFVLNYRVLNLKRLFVVLILFIALVMSIKSAESNYYSHHEKWTVFFEYNQVRGGLHGTERAILTEDMKKDILPQLGWTRVNYEMFMSWFFVDKDLYSKESLSRLLDYVKWEKPLEIDYNKLLKAVNGFLPQALFFCLVVSLILLIKQTNESRYKNIVLVVFALSILGYLGIFMRLPARVAEPMLLLVLLITSWNLAHRNSACFDRKVAGLVSPTASLAILVVAILFGVQGLYSGNNVKTKYLNNFEILLSDLYFHNPDALYVNWGGLIPFHNIDPFISGKAIPPLNYLGLGWRTHSPNFDAVLYDFDIKDLERSIIDRDDILLVCGARHLEILKQRALEKWGIEIQGEVVYLDKLTGMPAYRISEIH